MTALLGPSDLKERISSPNLGVVVALPKHELHGEYAKFKRTFAQTIRFESTTNEKRGFETKSQKVHSNFATSMPRNFIPIFLVFPNFKSGRLTNCDSKLRLRNWKGVGEGLSVQQKD